jgi:hypothetical protein
MPDLPEDLYVFVYQNEDERRYAIDQRSRLSHRPNTFSRTTPVNFPVAHCRSERSRCPKLLRLGASYASQTRRETSTNNSFKCLARSRIFRDGLSGSDEVMECSPGTPSGCSGHPPVD